MCSSNEDLSTCFSDISLASVFDEERTSMAVSSSRIFPSEEDNTSRILSSISFSCLWVSGEYGLGCGLLVALYCVVLYCLGSLLVRLYSWQCMVYSMASLKKLVSRNHRRLLFSKKNELLRDLNPRHFVY